MHLDGQQGKNTAIPGTRAKNAQSKQTINVFWHKWNIKFSTWYNNLTIQIFKVINTIAVLLYEFTYSLIVFSRSDI